MSGKGERSERGGRKGGGELRKLAVVRKEKLYTQKTDRLRDFGRRVRGTRWGHDVMQFEVEAGQGDVLLMWGEKLADSIAEAQLIDNYKMQVNIDSDGEGDGPVSQKEASVIKEGFMRKKKASHGVMEDLKRHWERRYCVLYNDGKLRFYESRQKKDEKGSLDLRFFALQEVEEDMEVEEEAAGDDEKQALKVQGHFFKIMKGKQFLLQSGKHAFYMASPEREVLTSYAITRSKSCG